MSSGMSMFRFTLQTALRKNITMSTNTEHDATIFAEHTNKQGKKKEKDRGKIFRKRERKRRSHQTNAKQHCTQACFAVSI